MAHKSDGLETSPFLGCLLLAVSLAPFPTGPPFSSYYLLTSTSGETQTEAEEVLTPVDTTQMGFNKPESTF